MDTQEPKLLGNAASGSLERRGGSRMQPNSSQRMTLSEAIQAVNAIVNCYPNGGRSAGDGYIGAMAAVLGDYPLSIAMKCADPRRGIASSSKFLPAVAELVTWLERELEKTSPPARAYPVFEPEPVVDRSRRLTYDELKAKYGDGQGGWGLNAERRSPWKPPSAEQLRAEIGDEAWDKLPIADKNSWQQLPKA